MLLLLGKTFGSVYIRPTVHLPRWKSCRIKSPKLYNVIQKQRRGGFCNAECSKLDGALNRGIKNTEEQLALIIVVTLE